MKMRTLIVCIGYAILSTVLSSCSHTFEWNNPFDPKVPPAQPTLAAPADSAIGVDSSLTLSWNSVEGATSYTLQVSDSIAFDTCVMNRGGFTKTNIALTGLSLETTYHWRVRADKKGNSSAWSATWAFTTRAAVDTIWTTGVPMQVARHDFSSVVIGNSLYAFGGWDNGPISSSERFEATTNLWSFVASIPDSLCAAGASVENGKTYIIGGVAIHNGWAWLNSNYEYDPVGNNWSSKLPMPTPRAADVAATVNNAIYVIGGYIEYTAFNTVEAYYPASNSWVGKASMPTIRCQSAVAVVNDIIYVIGGEADAWGSALLNTVEAYDPSTNSWSTRTPMPTKRYGCKATVYDGMIYVFGGMHGNNKVEMYDPIADIWTTKTPLPIGVYGPGAAELGGKIYIFGGTASNGQNLNAVQIYNPLIDK